MLKNSVPISVRSELDQVRRLLLDQRGDAGHWIGQLSASALSTATAISALSFYCQEAGKTEEQETINGIIEKGLSWLLDQQNDDGGWGDTASNYSNISTSMLVVAAFHACRRETEFAEVVHKGKQSVEQAGGVDGIRKRYGDDKTFAVPILANAAMAGLVDWKEVSALPFEAACVPQKFYHLLRLPVVSYAVPALVAIGQVKFKFDPPRNPIIRMIRGRCRERSLEVLQRMQPKSGGYLEAVPLTSFVCMALIKCGRADHSVVKNGIRFLLDSFRGEDGEQGSWPIDTNLATWVTTLSVNALCNDSSFEMEAERNPRLAPGGTDDSKDEALREFEMEAEGKPRLAPGGSEDSRDGESREFGSDIGWRETLEWLLDCQYKERHPFTGAASGGWGWSNLSGAVPDADDTPGALLALRNFRERLPLEDSDRTRINVAAWNGVDWLLGLQNRDCGWPTFCRGWGRLPFDRSGSDITAHVIRALHVWSDTAENPVILTRAIDRGFKYLSKNQKDDGSWLPLWFGNQDQVDDINPFYGTAKVLYAYAVTGRLDTTQAQNGLEWLRCNQNVDGGWGGGLSIELNVANFSGSSVEETALCTEALLLDQNASSQSAAGRGLSWLVNAVENGVVDRFSPIGFYFAKLWYFEKLYPLIFATSALGLAKSQIETDE